jgi:hypothetical protein
MGVEEMVFGDGDFDRIGCPSRYGNFVEQIGQVTIAEGGRRLESNK